MTTPGPLALPKSGTDGKLAQGWIDFTGYQTTLPFTPLDPANNLSHVFSVSGARASLGLGAAAIKGVQRSGAASLAAFGGGPSTPFDCVMFDVSGNLVASRRAVRVGLRSGSPNYTKTFTGQTTVTLAHDANSLAVVIACFDATENQLIPNRSRSPE